ncbi:hypothetical protein COO60DRAFT_1201004 [Scenedesmus sp. NREL 46B-D3]|nr:hypothetical protein COO60DRAFT_1201004 [Scenedesmus sp. NREL 46B-D3]
MIMLACCLLSHCSTGHRLVHVAVHHDRSPVCVTKSKKWIVVNAGTNATVMYEETALHACKGRPHILPPSHVMCVALMCQLRC